MKLILVSNYLNAHQDPFCREMMAIIGEENFRFIATTPFNGARASSGYEDMNQRHYVIKSYEYSDEAYRAVMDADVAICLPYCSPDYINIRMENADKLTFAYSERLLKRGLWFRHVPVKRRRVHDSFTRYRDRENFHVLCSSAFTSYDLSLFGFPIERCWKWGYFPVIPDCADIVDGRESISIVWAARFIRLKRPLWPLMLAEVLAKREYNFHLTMIGDGVLREKLQREVSSRGIGDYVTITGPIPNVDVYRIMAESDIFLFTSKRNEGWGAVLSEAMGNGCVPVASSLIGSVPFLIEDQTNGLIYKDGDFKAMCSCVETLIHDSSRRVIMRAEARRTMAELWNPRQAAKSIIELSSALIEGRTPSISDGPCSRAQIVTDAWYT